MNSFWRWQPFITGIAVTLGCISWLALEFGGLGHIPRVVELPGIALSALLDRVPESIATSSFWPNTAIEQFEGLLDQYQCPREHEYRVEILNHSPLILCLRGFLPPGEAAHLLKLAYHDCAYSRVMVETKGIRRMYGTGQEMTQHECTLNQTRIE